MSFRSLPSKKTNQLNLRYSASATDGVTGTNGCFIKLDDTNDYAEKFVNSIRKNRYFNQTIHSSTTQYTSSEYDPTTGLFAFVYADGGNNDRPTLVLGRMKSHAEGDALDIGDELELSTNACSGFMDICLVKHKDYRANGKFIVAYSTGSQAHAVLVKFRNDLDSAQVVSSVTINGGNDCVNLCMAYDTAAMQAVVVYNDTGNNSYLYHATILPADDGQSISVNSTQQITSSVDFARITYDESRGQCVLAFVNAGDSNHGYVATGGVQSGGAFTWGTAVEFFGHNLYSSTTNFDICYDVHNQRSVIVYRDTNDNNYGYARTVEITNPTNNTLSLGTAAKITDTLAVAEIRAAYNTTSHAIGVVFKATGVFNYPYMTQAFVTGASRDAITATDIIRSTNPNDGQNHTRSTLIYDRYNDRYIFSWIKSGFAADNYLRALPINPNNDRPIWYNKTGVLGVNVGGDVPGSGIPEVVVATTCSVANTNTTLVPGRQYYVQQDGTLGSEPAGPSAPQAGIAIGTSSSDTTGKILITAYQAWDRDKQPFHKVPLFRKGWRNGYNNN